MVYITQRNIKSIMNIGKFLKETREILGYSQRQVALYSGLSNATISRIEGGNVVPDAETLTKLSCALKIRREKLFEIAGYIDKPLNSTPNRSIKIPVLGHIAAGIPIEAIEDIFDWEEIPTEWTIDGSEFFGLRIKGNSMEPRIREDDIVIVRKQPDVNSGDVAVVFINGENATVKKIVKHENGLSLVPFNAVYTPKFFTDEEVINLPITIIGKVVELRGKF